MGSLGFDRCHHAVEITDDTFGATSIAATTPEEKTTTPYNTPDTTTPEDKTTTPFETPASTTPSTKRCVYNNFQYTPGEEIGKVKFNGRCYLVYCDLDSRIAKKSVECQTTPPTEKTTTAPTTPEGTTPEGTTPTTPEVTTPEGTTPTTPEVTTPTTPEVTTPEVTTPTVEQCTYKNFVYEPGQMIGIVMMQENCFLVLCDKDSQIRKKRVSCPTTTTLAETTTSSIIIEETTTPIGSTTTQGIIETTTPENVIETTTPFKEEFCVWNHFNYEA